MINLMAANEQPGGKIKRDDLEAMLRAQIDNSLDLGWMPRDIWIVANFPFAYRDVEARVLTMQAGCPTGSKMWALHHVLRLLPPDGGPVWAHDLDAWQNSPITEPPPFADVAYAEYSRPKFNGGSAWWKPSGADLCEKVIERILGRGDNREEPAINDVLRDRRHAKRVTVLNSTWNVGCSALRVRYERAAKPIIVCHLHPTNRLAWLNHTTRHDGQDGPAMSDRLKALLESHFKSRQRWRQEAA